MIEDNIFPRDQVLIHLEKISSDLAIEYLEYIIHELGDETPDFHNKLILAYLSKLKSMANTTPGTHKLICQERFITQNLYLSCINFFFLVVVQTKKKPIKRSALVCNCL